MTTACGGFLRERLLEHYVWVLMVKKYFFSPTYDFSGKRKGTTVLKAVFL